MADLDPHQQQQSQSNVAPRQPPQDGISELARIFAEVSNDPERLLKLLAAILEAERKSHAPVPDLTPQPTTLYELEQSLHLERTKQPRSHSPRFSEPPVSFEAGPANSPELDGAPLEMAPEPLHEKPEPAKASDRLPGWLDPAPPDLAEAPMWRPYAIWPRVTPLLKLGAAMVIGTALVLAISGWMHLARTPATRTARIGPPSLPAAILPGLAETVGYAQPRRIEPPPVPHTGLPFPLPASYGVYAGSDGQLTELEPLPVEVPVVRVSAEITRPSRVTVSGDGLAFVVFRQNLANAAPATIAARVVARVSRTVTLVDAGAKVTPLESSWRIRDKSYEFKVSVIEGNREMFVIQPDVELPAGRYALVLNGYGYDFTVAGPITAPEQCLEQTQVTNDVTLTECPAS